MKKPNPIQVFFFIAIFLTLILFTPDIITNMPFNFSDVIRTYLTDIFLMAEIGLVTVFLLWQIS